MIRAIVLLLTVVIGAADAQVGRRPKLPPISRGQNRVRRAQPGQNGLIDRERPGIGLERQQRFEQELMKGLNLTEAQRQRVTEIQRSHDPDLIAAGRRARLTRRALDEAIMSREYDEAEISRRSDEFAAAQSDVIKVRSRMRAEVRSLLTQEQVIRLGELERELRQKQREEKRRNELPRRGSAGKTQQDVPDYR